MTVNKTIQNSQNQTKSPCVAVSRGFEKYLATLDSQQLAP